MKPVFVRSFFMRFHFCATFFVRSFFMRLVENNTLLWSHRKVFFKGKGIKQLFFTPWLSRFQRKWLFSDRLALFLSVRLFLCGPYPPHKKSFRWYIVQTCLLHARIHKISEFFFVRFFLCGPYPPHKKRFYCILIWNWLELSCISVEQENHPSPPTEEME